MPLSGLTFLFLLVSVRYLYIFLSFCTVSSSYRSLFAPRRLKITKNKKFVMNVMTSQMILLLPISVTLLFSYLRDYFSFLLLCIFYRFLLFGLQLEGTCLGLPHTQSCISNYISKFNTKTAHNTKVTLGTHLFASSKFMACMIR